MAVQLQTTDAGTRFCWCDLPDPRASGETSCRLCSDVSAWKHLAQDSAHVRGGREPWDEWIGRELWYELSRAWSEGVSAARRVEIVRRVAEAVEDELRQCLQAPLLVRYECRKPSRADCPGQEHWLLVLPGGALICFLLAGRSILLKTCFFPKGACQALFPQYRWRVGVQQTVRRYAVCISDGRVLAPDAAFVRTIRGQQGRTKELHAGVRFVTEAAWGFDADGQWQCPTCYPLSPATTRHAPPPRLRPPIRLGEAVP